MFLVGLTGGIATGKSTASKYFSDLGCVIIDADIVAKEVVVPGKKAWRKIKERFGENIILPNGELDRNKLGQIIFGDAEKRKMLNSITHPEIFKCMAWRILQNFLAGEKFVILDVPLLFESGKMLPYLSYTVVVSCSEETQLNRLIKRNNLTEEEAKQRISSQMSMEVKRRRATYTLDNEGTTDELRQQVELLHREFNVSKAHWKLRSLLLAAVAFLAAFAMCVFKQFS